MRTYANRFGLLIEKEPGIFSICTGIDCNLSEANEVSLVLGFQSECFDNRDTETFVTLFNFHEAINDIKK